MIPYLMLILPGLCPVALGTDGGGSVRIPAAVCGIVGIKGKYVGLKYAFFVLVLIIGVFDSYM